MHQGLLYSFDTRKGLLYSLVVLGKSICGLVTSSRFVCYDSVKQLKDPYQHRTYFLWVQHYPHMQTQLSSNRLAQLKCILTYKKHATHTQQSASI